MDNAFFEYYNTIKITPDSYDCVIVLDTNVYLNFYKLNPNALRKFIKSLHRYKNNLWLPHQVGYEFYKNRLSKISNVKKEYSDLKALLEMGKNALLETINDEKNLDLKIAPETMDSFKCSSKKIIEKLKNMQYEFDEYIPKDKVLKEITMLFSSERIGKPYSSKELLNIIKEGEIRYKYNLPPGFEDKDKTENNFGDLIVWKQIIDYAKINKKSVLFITDDEKKDWWQKINGSFCLHPKLQSEFHIETNYNISSMNSENFFKYIDKEKVLEKEISTQWKPIVDDFVEQTKKVTVSSFNINLEVISAIKTLQSCGVIFDEKINKIGSNLDLSKLNDALDLHKLMISDTSDLLYKNKPSKKIFLK